MSSIQLVLGSSTYAAAHDVIFVWAMFWFAVTVSAIALGAKITLNAFKRSDRGVVRSALALILVTALALLTAVVHFDDSNDQRQMLMLGAVATLASAVVAFYFSARSADAARKDILSAVAGQSHVPVPDLTGMTVAAAKAKMSASNMSLDLPEGAPEDGVIAAQNPAAGQMVSPLQEVSITLAPKQG
ncbi:PASTA domain-containing protein [Streptomyces hesseae]|uniref:PASTA domain-containing protein n=1 Tax=Streptomyces hesseae TaxID=3075519 RepID=A0ABU2ST67_9ACTN|nr:PASTA domain-containing protein [Streptomyces sp. DSM 40473]MDT0452062.1 PASTA domain-containing protein [Streptomyces sp. DSM 40473]